MLPWVRQRFRGDGGSQGAAGEGPLEKEGPAAAAGNQLKQRSGRQRDGKQRGENGSAGILVSSGEKERRSELQTVKIQHKDVEVRQECPPPASQAAKGNCEHSWGRLRI